MNTALLSLAVGIVVVSIWYAAKSFKTKKTTTTPVTGGFTVTSTPSDSTPPDDTLIDKNGKHGDAVK